MSGRGTAQSATRTWSSLRRGNALGLRKKADIEKVLRNLFYPLLRAAEKSLAELWENPVDDAWKDA